MLAATNARPSTDLDMPSTDPSTALSETWTPGKSPVILQSSDERCNQQDHKNCTTFESSTNIYTLDPEISISGIFQKIEDCCPKNHNFNHKSRKLFEQTLREVDNALSVRTHSRAAQLAKE
jgi:hypothetical protein